jgi:hypothetical protein
MWARTRRNLTSSPPVMSLCDLSVPNLFSSDENLIKLVSNMDQCMDLLLHNVVTNCSIFNKTINNHETETNCDGS